MAFFRGGLPLRFLVGEAFFHGFDFKEAFLYSFGDGEVFLHGSLHWATSAASPRRDGATGGAASGAAGGLADQVREQGY